VKSPLTVDNAPRAIGPYTQAQVVRLHGGGRMLFTSGQIALDPATGALRGDDAAAQTEQVFRNLGAILEGAGLSFADVVKTTVYLASMDDFQAMNEVYARHFDQSAPARTTIAAAELPKNARVEIDAVAISDEY
jgi:2-iminobutanoate/2-iminopropanoate deaminase